VRAEFPALSAAAREALTGMRKLLGLLRDDRPVELNPQPDLTDLPELVETARRAGARIELTVAANGSPAPQGVGVCAYRIAREALSNTGRHAPGSSVSVVVGQDAEFLRLLIVNGPGPADSVDPVGAQSHGGQKPADEYREPGHGLVGMRERVALLGGSLTSGPAEDGGFTVWATLPLAGTEVPAHLVNERQRWDE
jgi:signal transduction histidine kinase